MSRTTRRGGRAFTIIEVAVATAVVGLGVAALLTATAAVTRTNDAGRNLTRAVFLAQEIREWTLKLPFSDTDPADQDNPPGPDGLDPQVYVDDLDDLMQVTYGPPRDGQGIAIADMSGWQQAISITWRDPDNLAQTVTPGTSDVVYVQVAVSYHGRPIMTTGWLSARPESI